MSLRNLISELCEIEVGLYLDYYNDIIKSYKEFTEILESEKKNIIKIVYDLLDAIKAVQEFIEAEATREWMAEFKEKVDRAIIGGIKEQGEYYRETPEWFGKDEDGDDGSAYYNVSGYYESTKNKKYPFHEKCGYTLSLVKRFFTTRKAIRAELAYKKSAYNNLDEGMREMIYNHMRAMQKNNTKRIKSKRNKSKRKKSKRNKSKRKNK